MCKFRNCSRVGEDPSAEDFGPSRVLLSGEAATVAVVHTALFRCDVAFVNRRMMRFFWLCVLKCSLSLIIEN